jgi:hypothetical protein
MSTSASRSRLNQWLLVLTFIPFCWLAMQAVHELGHALAAALTGGSVNKVVLHPLALSRTDVNPNPHPLIVVWAGPFAGSLLPLGAWLLVRSHQRWLPSLFRFFAGFCLVANGVYLIGGSFAKGADPGEMMKLGSPQALLVGVGTVGLVLGMWLWHGQGSDFGLGTAQGRVEPRAVVVSVSLLIITVSVSLLFDSR